MEKRPGAPLWAQIHDTLRQELKDLVYPPGTRFPSEEKLTARFGVNRHTVRRALNVLQDAGLIRRERGRGAFVTENVLTYQVARRTRFSDNMSLNLACSSSRLIASQVTGAGELAAARLGLTPGRHKVTILETFGEAGGKPVYVSTQYMPFHRFPGLEDIFRKTGSLTQSYRHFGVQDYYRRESRISTRLPSAQEAQLLRQPREKPLLVIEYVNVDTKEVPIEYGVTRFAGERMQVVVECGMENPLEKAVAARLSGISGRALEPGRTHGVEARAASGFSEPSF